jgi:hypothetical protein
MKNEAENHSSHRFYAERFIRVREGKREEIENYKTTLKVGLFLKS